MKMFRLDHQTAKLIDVNPRTEVHGDEHVRAADLRFVFNAPNDILNEFDLGLKGSLYRKPDAKGDQLDLEPGWAPKLRFPNIGAIEWEQEVVGGDLRIAYGLDAINLQVRSADKFRFQTQDGGTVTVSFRVQVKPTEEQMGRLCFMLQEEVELTFQPPQLVDLSGLTEDLAKI